MKLIKPSWEILEQEPGLQGIYKQIELAGRTCYKSLDKITEDSAEGFVNRMIASKHYAMLEHGTVYLRVPINIDIAGDFLDDVTTWTKCKLVTEDTGNWWAITTNYRRIIELGYESHLQYLCEPTEFHEKRVTVRFTTSNSIMREFTRHRSHSFAIESTRYCNYSKDKFNNELTFIQPFWINEEMSLEEASRYALFRGLLEDAETTYLNMIKSGMKPQEAREVLPLATKCDMVMTGFISDWEHLCRLRSSFAETGQPHPDMKALVDPLLEEFISRGYLKEIVKNGNK